MPPPPGKGLSEESPPEEFTRLVVDRRARRMLEFEVGRRATARRFGKLCADRERDILPFPFGQSGDWTAASGSLVTPRRRVLRRAHRDDLVDDMCAGLNFLAGAQPKAAKGPLNAVQEKAMSHLAAVAAQELLAKTTYEGEASSIVPLEVDALALLADGFCPVDLSTVGGRFGRDLVERLETKVLAAHLAARKKEEAGGMRTYFDPVFRHRPRVYAAFAKRLLGAGLMELRHDCEGRVGAFAVRKKGSEQRLIIGARPCRSARGCLGRS